MLYRREIFKNPISKCEINKILAIATPVRQSGYLNVNMRVFSICIWLESGRVFVCGI